VRNFLTIFLIVLLFPLVGGTDSTPNLLKETRLIRRVYLEVLSVPPTPIEMEWYLVYNKDSYLTALNHVIKERARRDAGYPTIKMKSYYETDLFKNKTPEKLPKEVLHFIIKYQVGGVNDTLESCISKMIDNAIVVADNHPVDGFDYLAECLINRTLSMKEANDLLKEYRKYSNEREGYQTVFNKLIEFEDFLFN
jgi:hypothetical protein